MSGFHHAVIAGSYGAVAAANPAIIIDHTGFAAALEASDTAVSIDLATYISGGTSPFTTTASHGTMTGSVWTWTAPETAGTTNIRFTTTDDASEEAIWGADYVVVVDPAAWTDITDLASDLVITSDTGGWVEGPTGTLTAALTQGRYQFYFTGDKTLPDEGTYRISANFTSMNSAGIRAGLTYGGRTNAVNSFSNTAGPWSHEVTPVAGEDLQRIDIRHYGSGSPNTIMNSVKVEELGAITATATGVPPAASSLAVFIAPGDTATTSLGGTVHSVEIVGDDTQTYSGGTLTRAGIDSDLVNAHVVHVTNRNDSGTGSLRAAVQDSSPSGPRIVVFDVGGTINLSSELGLTRDNVYIAGQTAPGQGILITGDPVICRASNVIIRGLMLRPGVATSSAEADTKDGFGIRASNDLNDVWIDQCDIMHSIDEQMGIRNNGGYLIDRVSITNCLTAEPFRATAVNQAPIYAHETEHNFGFLMGRGTRDYLLADTILAGCRARTPIIETGTRGCIFGMFTHDYQTGGNASNGEKVPIQPLTKTNSEVTYLADKSVKYSVSGHYAEPGALSRAQGSTQAPWISWPAVDNGGQGYTVYLTDNWFPAGWQSVMTATGGYGGTLPASGRALDTPGLGSDLISSPEMWSHHQPTHGTETRTYTLAHAGARPGNRDACADRNYTKIAGNLGKGLASWSASGWDELYLEDSAPPADTPPTVTTSAWSEPANPFTVAANGLTNIENTLDELMASLGGAWPRNVERPIRPLAGGKLTVNRNGTVNFDSLDEFDGISANEVISVLVTYTDGTDDTLTITVEAP